MAIFWGEAENRLALVGVVSAAMGCGQKDTTQQAHFRAQLANRRNPIVYPPTQRLKWASRLFPRRAGAQRSQERRAPARRAANPIADTHSFIRQVGDKCGCLVSFSQRYE